MKKDLIYGGVLALLLGVIFYLIYGVGGNLIAEQKALLEEIATLEQRIVTYKSAVVGMKAEIRRKEVQYDSLRGVLDSTALDLVEKRKELRYYAKRFKALTNRERDSVLFAYIRANQ